MKRHDSEILGRVIAREVCRERIVDGGGVETGSLEDRREVIEAWDGSVETHVSRVIEKLDCGHVRRPGMPFAQCERCSKKSKTAFRVCVSCAIVCAVCGRSVCLRCTKPAPGGYRFCKGCFRKGLELLEGTGDSARAHAPLPDLGRLIDTVLRYW